MTSTATRLYGLDSPHMRIDAATMVIGAEGEVTIPMPAYLIEHEQGLVLFDTSMNPAVCDDPASVFGDSPVADMIISNPEQRLDRQLALLGYRPEDVTHVILSHTHADHAGGLFMFPDAQFHIGPGEFRWAANPREDSAHLFAPSDLTRVVKEYSWNTVDAPSQDLFGDGAIVIHHTPGHTPGELSALVRLPSQNIVLTGDTVHLREALEWDAPDPKDWDFDAARASIATLKRLQIEEQARIWIAHDERDWADFGGPRHPLV
jgi:glyoxylase-like metal-dependent hydrolase (beta-lactamase superfamily II)